MNLSKLIFSIVLLCTIQFTTNAQSKANYESPLFFNGKVSLGLGVGNTDVPISSGQMSVGYGGGFGFEAGVGYYISNNFSVIGNIGYAMKLSYNSTSSSYAGNVTSSEFFGRALFRGGLQYEIITNQSGKLKGFRLGTGILYEIPGGYSVTENNEDLGTIEYQSNTGFYVELGLPIHFSNKVKLIPFLRYNGKSTVVTSSPLNNVGKAVNGSSIEMGASIDLHF